MHALLKIVIDDLLHLLSIETMKKGIEVISKDYSKKLMSCKMHIFLTCKRLIFKLLTTKYVGNIALQCNLGKPKDMKPGKFYFQINFL